MKKMFKKMLLTVFVLAAVNAFGMVSTTTTEIQYTGNGSSTEFAFNFPLPGDDTSDLTVILRLVSTGVPTILTETTHYTVTATNNEFTNGGTVTTVATYSSDYTLTIRRDSPDTQEADITTDSGVLRKAVLEGAIDKNTMLIQQQQTDLNRTPKFPASDPTASLGYWPNSIDRAGLAAAFDSTTGAPTAIAMLPESGVAISAFMETVLDDASAVLAMATLQGIPVINVMNSEYGADGTGSTSDNAAIALAATAAADSTLVFPKGTYLIDDDITIGSTVQLLFLRGAQLSIDTGKTFTIGGQAKAGYYEIFTGAGSVSFTTEIDNWKPEWFGTTLGVRNTISGFQAGEDLTSATACTVYGHQAGANITSGAKHTAVGAFALAAVTDALNCTAVGYLAGQKNTASNITAVGSNALANNVTATGGTAVGISALASQNNVLAIDNTAVGVSAGNDNLSGSNLTIVGARAMLENTTALNGVAIGVEAGHGNIHNEQIQDGDFSVEDLPTGWTLGSGWAVDNSNNEVDKSSDGTGTLTATETQGGDAHIDYGVGVTYQIAYTILNHSVGDVTVTFGGETDTTRSGDGDFTWDVTPSVYNDAARALTFTPTNTSRFSVTDVSFTLSTAASHSGLTAVGVGAGYMVTEGDNNTWIGIGAGRQNGGGENMTGVGAECFRQGGGSGGVGLGKQAGYYETGSNKLFIDNTSRSSESDGRLKALIYGEFNADPDSQLVRVNGMFESYAVSTRTVEVSSAEMLDLAANPKELVAAPGADHLLEFVSATLIYDSAATDYTVQADENIAIRYENGSGTIVSLTVESDDLIKEAASDGIRIVHPIATFQDTDVIGAVNKSLVLDNVGSGEWDDGTGTLTVKITWRLHELGL